MRLGQLQSDDVAIDEVESFAERDIAVDVKLCRLDSTPTPLRYQDTDVSEHGWVKSKAGDANCSASSEPDGPIRSKVQRSRDLAQPAHLLYECRPRWRF